MSDVQALEWVGGVWLSTSGMGGVWLYSETGMGRVVSGIAGLASVFLSSVDVLVAVGVWQCNYGRICNLTLCGAGKSSKAGNSSAGNENEIILTKKKVVRGPANSSNNIRIEEGGGRADHHIWFQRVKTMDMSLGLGC